MDKIDRKLVIECLSWMFYEYDIDEYMGGEALTEELLKSSRDAEQALGRLLQGLGMVSTEELHKACQAYQEE